MPRQKVTQPSATAFRNHKVRQALRVSIGSAADAIRDADPDLCPVTGVTDLAGRNPQQPGKKSASNAFSAPVLDVETSS